MTPPILSALQILLRAIATLWAVFMLLYGLFFGLTLDMLGFPDGSINPYDRETGTLLWGLTIACVILSLCFFAIVIAGRPIRALRLAAQIIAAAILVMLPMLMIESCPRLDACQRAYLAIFDRVIDDGTGG